MDTANIFNFLKDICAEQKISPVDFSFQNWTNKNDDHNKPVFKAQKFPRISETAK